MKIEWDALTKRQWDALAEDAPIQQQWAFGEALAEVGPPRLRAVVRDRGKVRAIAQFSVGGVARMASWSLCTRGPVWIGDPDDDERAEILKRLRAAPPLRRPSVMIFMPDAPLDVRYPSVAGLRRVMTGFNTVDIDLRPSLKSLRAGLHGKWRNRLRAAEKAGLEIRPIGRRLPQYQWLLDKETEQKKAKRYMSPPTTLTPAYQKASGDKRALRVVGAFRPDQAEGERPLAAMLFLRHGAAATYHIGWSSGDGRKLGAHNLLLWNAIETFRDEGLRRLDLGEADTGDGAGLARFKIGAGGRPTTLCGAFL